MKITGLRIDRHSIPYTPKYKSEARSAKPLDVYPEYDSGERSPRMRAASDYKDRILSEYFLVISTDEGVEGIHGPVDYRGQLLIALEGLAPLLIGRDPLENRLLWDVMSRFDRHARSGLILMALSAVDIALWDLKGKILGQPVYKLLGGGREKLRPYVSMLSFSVEPDRAREYAAMVRNMGVRAQKWFFRYGPAQGEEGMRKNMALAEALREELGDGYELMFDCWMGWDVVYAKEMLRRLEPIHPVWVEEALRPHMVDGYHKLHAETRVPLAAGEHLYTRMEVNGYLRDGIFDVMQSDPEWCGGITEALRIADLCETYGVRCIQHGHGLLPAMQVAAAMPPDVVPYVEYLLNFIDHKTAFFAHDTQISPDGFLKMNETPGIGEDLCQEKIVETQTFTRFELG